MVFVKRKFAYAHPRFGRTAKQKESESFKNSVYFYWWEFLRRSEKYEKCCKKGGKGPLAPLYNDFGNVFETDFKSWWSQDDRGARLFAESPDSSLPFGLVTEPTQSTDDVLIIRVPLALPKRFLQTEFYSLLSKHHKGRRGRRTNASSTAMYPVVGHVDIFSIDRCLRVYDLRTSSPKMPLWEIGNTLKVINHESLIRDADTKAELVSKKNILATVTDRYYRRAKRLIEAVEQGKFPIR